MTKSQKVAALVLAVACAGVVWVAMAKTTQGEPVAWNDRASDELAHTLHQMHDVWNKGDIKALKNLVIGDDVLITFELDPATHKPIKLAGKAELFKFVDAIEDNRDADEATFVLGHPGVRCKATDSFGICTEECEVTVKYPNNTEERYKLWSTATAIRYPDGWKWIQWHMSSAGPIEVFKNGVKVAEK